MQRDGRPKSHKPYAASARTCTRHPMAIQPAPEGRARAKGRAKVPKPRPTPLPAKPIQNAEVAAAFDEIADLLEIEGANVFRVRAYRTV